MNYLPGMGGFLQSLLYGFGGLRVRPQLLEFHKPTPPPQAEWLRVENFTYLGNRMLLDIGQSEVHVEVYEVSNEPLMLKQNDSRGLEENLTPGRI